MKTNWIAVRKTVVVASAMAFAGCLIGCESMFAPPPPDYRVVALKQEASSVDAEEYALKAAIQQHYADANELELQVANFLAILDANELDLFKKADAALTANDIVDVEKVTRQIKNNFSPEKSDTYFSLTLRAREWAKQDIQLKSRSQTFLDRKARLRESALALQQQLQSESQQQAQRRLQQQEYWQNQQYQQKQLELQQQQVDLQRQQLNNQNQPRSIRPDGSGGYNIH